MRTVWLIPLVLTACGDVGSGDGPKGTYAVSWKLAAAGMAPTCTSHRITDVIVSATDMATNNTVNVTTACAMNMVMLEAPLGTHRIKLEAIGEFDDVAGMVETNGTITEAGMVITLPEANVTVLSATSMANPHITLQRLGQPTTCSATQSTGISITVTPMTGEPTTDIFDCGTGPFVLAVPYGPYAVKADLLGTNDVVIGTSTSVMVPATRGTATPDVVIAAN